MNCLPLSGTILSASILVGFTTALILFCSHFHQVLNLIPISTPVFTLLGFLCQLTVVMDIIQVEGDRAVGKMSPLVNDLS